METQKGNAVGVKLAAILIAVIVVCSGSYGAFLLAAPANVNRFYAGGLSLATGGDGFSIGSDVVLSRAGANSWTLGAGDTLTIPTLTSGRIPIAGVGGLVADDADLTFVGGDTLTATNVSATSTYTSSLYVNSNLYYPEQENSYTIWNDTGTIYSRNEHTGAVSTGVALTVIQAAIDAVNTAYVAGNGGGVVTCKGLITIASGTILVKPGVTFIFDTIEQTTDDHIIKTTTINQNARIIGRKIIAPTAFSKIALWVYDTYLLDVDIQTIIVKTGFGAGGSIGLKVLAETNAVTTMYNRFKIQAIDSFETGIYLAEPGYSTGSINANDFYDTKITGWVNAVTLAKDGGGEISYNNFHSIKAWAPKNAGVETAFLFTGATNVLANNFFGCQASDMGATDVALNLSAGAVVNWYGGNFDSGLTSPVLNNGILNCYDIYNYTTENTITSTINSGATSTTIAHGLSYTPTSANTAWTITYLEVSTNDPGPAAVTMMNATHATISCLRDPGASNLDITVAAQKVP